MSLQVQVETLSKISRKLTVRVPAQTVDAAINRGLAEVQKDANLKGFRPGQAPLSVVKQFYGKDVQHRVFHSLIEDSLNQALQEHKILAVGQPQIDTPDHKHGEGAHDHGVQEGHDLTFVATVEVMPEVEVKGYTGVALTAEKVEVTEEAVQKIVTGILDSHAELIPVGSGLVMADGTSTGRAIQTGDHVDLTFDGGIVTALGVQKQEGMKGTRTVEVGSNSLIPGFEDQLIGMRGGQNKTFRIKFPEDYGAADIAGKEAEFAVEVHEFKEKKLPELNDEFAKNLGYESVEDMRAKARQYLEHEGKSEADRKTRSQLLSSIIEKNPFDVPRALVESQARALVQDLMQELKQQGGNDQLIQQMVMQEAENLRKRAEGQVRASLILEAIAKKEEISVKSEELEEEVKRLATSMKVEEAKLREYYQKNPGRMDDLEFRLRQERTVQFLMEKAKVKTA